MLDFVFLSLLGRFDFYGLIIFYILYVDFTA